MSEKSKNLGKKGGYYFGKNTPLFDPENPLLRSGRLSRENVGFALNILEKSSDWKELTSLIEKNNRVIPPVPMPKTKKGTLSKRSGLPPEFNRFTDYRDAFQAYLEEQLSTIKKKFGGIERTSSWFAHPL
jgi:hypothetical protein